jgi:hypothetical protein
LLWVVLVRRFAQPAEDTLGHVPTAIATDFAVKKISEETPSESSANATNDGDKPPASAGHGAESGAGTAGFVVSADTGVDGTLPVRFTSLLLSLSLKLGDGLLWGVALMVVGVMLWSLDSYD